MNWRMDDANDVFSKIRVQRKNSAAVHDGNNNPGGQLAPGCLKAHSGNLLIDVNCGESTDHEKVYFKLAEFNWHGSSAVFEAKYADSYNPTALSSRLCSITGGSADSKQTFGACSPTANSQNWVRFQRYSDWSAGGGAGLWSHAPAGDALTKIGRLLVRSVQAPGGWAMTWNPNGAAISDTTDSQDTAANLMQASSLIATNNDAAGRQFFKVNTGTGSDWSTWTIQRNQQNTQNYQPSGGANHGGTAANYNHCIKRLANANIGTHADCTSPTRFMQFKFAAFAWATQAAIMDDPEVTNIHKEKFKVNNKGGITLLHLPRDAPIGKAYLVLVAEIQELYGWNHTRLKAAKCTPTFVRNLLVAGTALGELTAMTFHARNNTAPFLMGFGNKVLWLPDGNITDAAIAYYTKDVNIPADVSFAVTEAKPGYPKAIQITIGSVKLSVRRPHIPEGRHWQFLNLQVDGLDSLQYSAHDFGGVMGFDSPSEATSKHNTCLSSARKWKGRTEAKDVSLAASSGSILQMISVDSDDDAKPDEDVAQA